MRTMILTASILFAAIFGVIGKGKRRLFNAGPSLNGATGWLNTQPLDIKDLRGKVVLIDFWTYTCINWRRTVPYVREWASKYKNDGLIVVGVHTPEFLFEQKIENIRNAIKQMNIVYPVATDNNFEIWRSFNNAYWPALYLIDDKGEIRYKKFGEGDYIETETQIRKLLRETSSGNTSSNIQELHSDGYEAAADWDNLRSPETFLGYSRTRGFASPESIAVDQKVVYSLPVGVMPNNWALSGTWTIRDEFILLNKGNGKIIFRFHARDLHLIMGPSKTGTSLKFRVLIDGKPPGVNHGIDTDSNGYGTVNEQRMYQLIRQRGPVDEKTFQIEFLDPEVEVYDFTFG